MILGTAAYMAPEQAQGQDRRQARGHLGVRRRAVRDAHRARARSRARMSSDTLANVLQDASRRGTRLPADAAGARCGRCCGRCLQKDPKQRARRHRRRAPRARGRIRDGRVTGDTDDDRIVARTTALDGRPRRRGGADRGDGDARRCAICARRRHPLRLRCAWRSRRPPPTRRCSSPCRPTAAPSSLSRRAMGRHGCGCVRSIRPRRGRWRARRARRHPFWSPDSRSIGFFAAGKLLRLDVAGGAPQVLATASGDQPRRQLERGRHDPVCAAGDRPPVARRGHRGRAGGGDAARSATPGQPSPPAVPPRRPAFSVLRAGHARGGGDLPGVARRRRTHAVDGRGLGGRVPAAGPGGLRATGDARGAPAGPRRRGR